MKNKVNRASAAKKNKILFVAMLFIACLFSSQLNAQLKVADTGNVGIALSDETTPLSNLSIGGPGWANAKLSVNRIGNTSAGDCFGIYSFINGTTANYWRAAVAGVANAIGGNVIGVRGEVLPANPNSSPGAYMYGVYGMAGGANSWRNFGVYGFLNTGDLTKGAGVYGTNSNVISALSARYAGYFCGNTEVNGTLYYVTQQATSDARLKTNISDIKKDALKKVEALHPVQFQWKQVEDVVIEDTVVIKTPHFSEDIDFDKKHYGLLAQDVQKLFPELVEEKGDGYLSVNYMELIPLLIQSVQELSAEIEELKKQNK